MYNDLEDTVLKYIYESLLSTKGNLKWVIDELERSIVADKLM